MVCIHTCQDPGAPLPTPRPATARPSWPQEGGRRTRRAGVGRPGPACGQGPARGLQGPGFLVGSQARSEMPPDSSEACPLPCLAGLTVTQAASQLSASHGRALRLPRAVCCWAGSPGGLHPGLLPDRSPTRTPGSNGLGWCQGTHYHPRQAEGAPQAGEKPRVPAEGGCRPHPASLSEGFPEGLARKIPSISKAAVSTACAGHGALGWALGDAALASPMGTGSDSSGSPSKPVPCREPGTCSKGWLTCLGPCTRGGDRKKPLAPGFRWPGPSCCSQWGSEPVGGRSLSSVTLSFK